VWEIQTQDISSVRSPEQGRAEGLYYNPIFCRDKELYLHHSVQIDAGSKHSLVCSSWRFLFTGKDAAGK
jgi:hypothetical protein